jgi:hypothetical protein
MTDTTHEAPDKMKTIRLTVDLTYDQEVMHGDDEQAIAWFNGILAGKDLLLGDFGELGDMIGSVKVVTQQDDLVQAAVAAALREAAEALNYYVDADYCAMGYPEDGGIAASGTAKDCQDAILALITPDAQAALDRVVAAERDRAFNAGRKHERDLIHAFAQLMDTEGKAYAEQILAAIRKGGE